MRYIYYNKVKRTVGGLMMVLMFSFVPQTASGQTQQLVILHTNDTHSTLYPLNPNLADTALAGRGGFLRRIAMLKRSGRSTPICYCSTAVTSVRALLISPCTRVMWR